MTASGEVAVAAALSVLGRPYVYGAAAGDTSCFDCSSLVQWAWRHAGAALPRAAIDQVQAVAPLAMDDLRPGDLVFYDYHLPHGPRYRGVNHVVMYVGDGRVVEASSKTWAVRVTALVEKGRPAGAGRPGAEARTAPRWRYEIRRAYGLTVLPGGRGGWVVERGGRVIPVGDAPFLGPPRSPSRVAGIAAVPSGGGYWLADPASGVVAVGTAVFRGDLRGVGTAREPVVAIAADPSGSGYWLADAGGRVFAFGTAPHRGDLRTAPLSVGAPVVGMAADPSGGGYWLVDAAGRVSAFGCAAHRGDLRQRSVPAPIVAIAAAPTATGYWLADAAGRVSAFGCAAHRGQRRRGAASEPVVAMAAAGDGYWLADAGGSVSRVGGGTR